MAVRRNDRSRANDSSGREVRGGLLRNALFAAVSLLGCAVALLSLPASAAAQPAVDGPVRADGARACRPSVLGKRDLFLRGTFNAWGSDEAYRFAYVCDHYELVARIDDTHSFKVGDEGWSADADFGGDAGRAGDAWPLRARGPGLQFTFRGFHRIVLSLPPMSDPALRVESCPAPFGEKTLFLRGTMNNWAALDDFAFAYRCDAYYLNVRLTGRHEFKIADAAWERDTTLGIPPGPPGDAPRVLAEGTHALAPESAAAGVDNVSHAFAGENTIRLAFHDGRPQLTIGPLSYVDPRQSTVRDPIALSLHHDSRDPADKAPFGAVPAGTSVTFALRALPGVKSVVLVVEKRRLEGNQDLLEYAEVARVPMRRDRADGRDRWRARHRFADASVYGYYFEARIGNQTYVYQNNRDAVHWTREKGANGEGLVDELPDARKGIRRFRHTVYAADFKVPDWARDAVYYYVFPDRFRNGDPRNDPRPGVDRYQDKAVEFHRNWLEKPYKPGSGDGSDAVYNNDFFGGDIAGIIEKLDYIADLGANALYITPLFRASSNHKYDTADYRNIDPHFGSNDDFVRLTTAAAKRGIRVIPDVSLNHTGADSIYFDRFGKYQSKGAFEGARIRRDSPYADWYSFDETQTDPDRQFKGWVGVLDLPELNKASPGFRQFAFGAPDSVMKLWLDRGAAGWRMDVAPWVPDAFWREWRRAIKRHRPDALTIAETWFDASKFFLGDTFDSTMNYIFRNTVLDYAAGGKARQAYRNIELMREVYPPQAFFALMNLLSSHDVARALYVLGDLGEGTAPDKVLLAKQRLRLAVFFQMIFPGAPAIYYGDEVGVTGGDDPYNRATYPWSDLGGNPDTVLLADFRRLIKMRQDHAILRRGSLGAPLHIDDHVIVLAREFNKTWAITATNNSPAPQSIVIELPPAMATATFADALSARKVAAADGRLAFTVPPLFGIVLISQ